MPAPSSPPSAPAGVPSGNGKYIVIAILLLGGIGGISYVFLTKKPQPIVEYVEAGVPDSGATAVNTNGRNPEDDIPLPPPVIDAGKATATSTSGGTSPGAYQCDARKCSGDATSDLQTALSFRTKQAHRCYDTALSQDPTLKGKVTVSVRVGTNGQTCSASIVSNDMGSTSVGNCVANYFRGQSFPAPRGGCVDAQIPINFVPRQ